MDYILILLAALCGFVTGYSIFRFGIVELREDLVKANLDIKTLRLANKQARKTISHLQESQRTIANNASQS